MKLDRLIGILSVLLQKDKVTAPYLAEKFEVSKRTIQRDIEALCKAGVPVITSQGQGGGISVMDGYRIDRTLLTYSDMQAILAGLKSLDSVSETNRYKQLMDKISTDDSDGSVIIDLSSWDKSAFSDKIEIIKNAIDAGEKISFMYHSPKSESKRVIEPYHLVFQWSSWYAWGFCEKRMDYRMFKLTRMTELECTGEKREDREVPEYVCNKLTNTDNDIKALVRFDISEKWRIIDDFGADRIKYDGDDILMEFTWSDTDSFYRYILTFCDKAEIVEPMKYRKEFSELVKRISQKYIT